MSEIGSSLTIAALSEAIDTPAVGLTRAARLICESQTDEAPLIGHVVIGVFADGAFSCGFRCPEDRLIGPTLFTAYVKEIIERELTGKQAADDYAKEFLS